MVPDEVYQRVAEVVRVEIVARAFWANSALRCQSSAFDGLPLDRSSRSKSSDGLSLPTATLSHIVVTIYTSPAVIGPFAVALCPLRARKLLSSVPS